MRTLTAIAAITATLVVGGSAHAATLLFLNVPGIPGESMFPPAQNQIELLSYSLGVNPSKATRYGTVGVCAVGQTKPTLSDFCVTKRVDIASPKLFLAANKGTVFPTVTISVFGADESNPPLAVYVLSNAIVSSVTTTGGAGDDVPLESVCFKFTREQITTTHQNAAGGMSITEVAGFDACQATAF